MIYVVVGSFAALSLGLLLIGIAAIIDVCRPYRRIECGTVAVER